MESRPFDNLLAIGLLLDFRVEERKHALHWRAITRRIISFISYRPWLLRRQKICKDLGLSWAIIGPQRGCQTLASGTWGPRKLAEVLEAMQHFHCTDVRDRLYGVLSLVDWQDTTIPVPDYEQDSFQIAVEIMRHTLDNGHVLQRRTWLLNGLSNFAECSQSLPSKSLSAKPLKHA
jgi:hypothetical protein